MVDHESAIIVPSPNMSTGRMSRRSSPGAKRSARDEEVDLLTPLLQRSNSRDKGRFASDPTTTAPALSLRGSPNTTRAAKSTRHHRRKRSQIAPTTIRDVGLFGNLYLNVAMYAFANQLWNPLLPYIVRNAGGSTVELGYVMGLHSLMSMVGSVLAGPGIDRHGTRLILALSYGLSAFSFLLVWAQPGMLAVYASRIFVLFQQALLASRAHIAIATGSDTKLISYVSLFYGFGSVLGPAAASIIVERYSLAHTSLLAGCVNLLSAVLVLVYGLGDAPKFWVGTETTARRAIVEVPGSNHAALARQRRILHRRRASSVNEVFTRSGIQSIVRCWRTVPAVRFVFSLKLLIVFATAIFHSVLALTMAERFGLAPAENGWVFAYCGGIAVAAQLAYNLLNIRANAEQRALFILSTVMALAYAATSISSSMLMFCAALLPLMGAGTVLHSITTAMLTRDIEMHDNGTIIGMDMAVSSLQRIISPLIGTWIIGQSASYASIGWACASMVVGSLIVQARALQNVGGKQLPH